MSGQTELPRYSGAATIIRYAVYVHRGIIPAEDLHETFDGGSVLVTSSPERAIAEGLPPAAHRPPIGSILGGPPPPAWSADGAVERLRARLRSDAHGQVWIDELHRNVPEVLDPASDDIPTKEPKASPVGGKPIVR